jgi:hypothetical protein
MRAWDMTNGHGTMAWRCCPFAGGGRSGRLSALAGTGWLLAASQTAAKWVGVVISSARASTSSPLAGLARYSVYAPE